MSEDNIVTRLVELYKQKTKLQEKYEDAQYHLNSSARDYAETHSKLQNIISHIRNHESNIKNVWGEEALEVAWKKVDETIGKKGN